MKLDRVQIDKRKPPNTVIPKGGDEPCAITRVICPMNLLLFSLADADAWPQIKKKSPACQTRWAVSSPENSFFFYRPETTVSKTSLTFSTSTLGVNGFCKNATPRSSVPFSAITLYVYPDIYSTRTEGCRAKTLFANSRPLTPGIITSVSKR